MEEIKEFWICPYQNEVCGSYEDLRRVNPEAEPIHVIRYSEYERAVRDVQTQIGKRTLAELERDEIARDLANAKSKCFCECVACSVHRELDK